MRTLALTALLIAATASPALAGTVTFTPGVNYPEVGDDNCPPKVNCGPPPDIAATISYAGRPGEANVVTFEQADIRPDGRPGSVTIHDTAGATTDPARTECTQVDATTVRCVSGVPEVGVVVNVTLGDGNDRLTAGAATTVLFADGGDGNDVITNSYAIGGAGSDTLTGDTLDGGEGQDILVAAPDSRFAQLEGGPDRDTITGGPRADRISSIGGGAGTGDVIDGGGGRDLLTYLGSSSAAIVDLAGTGPSTDDLTDIEDAEGSGQFGDILRGDAGTNRLYAGSGEGFVIMEGRGGNDLLRTILSPGILRGGSGDDNVFVDDDLEALADGGTGNDTVRIPVGGIGSCGAGSDVLRTRQAEPGEPITLGPAGCETISGGVAVRRSSPRRLTLTVHCPARITGVRRCVVMAKRPRGRRVARATIAAGATQTIYVPIVARDKRTVVDLTRREVFDGRRPQTDRRRISIAT